MFRERARARARVGDFEPTEDIYFSDPGHTELGVELAYFVGLEEALGLAVDFEEGTLA